MRTIIAICFCTVFIAASAAHKSRETILKELLQKESVTNRNVEQLSIAFRNDIKQMERVDQLYETIGINGDFKKQNIWLILQIMLLEEQRHPNEGCAAYLASRRLSQFYYRNFGLIR